MEAEDDMIVLVVVDDDEKPNISGKEYSTPSDTCLEVDDIIETAQKHGQYVDVKLEPVDDYQCDYLEDDMSQSDIKLEPTCNTQDDNNDNNCFPIDEEYLQLDESDTAYHTNGHRVTMLKPWQQKSFVAELRQEYEELREDEELLISVLENIMRKVKAPPPPKDYYIKNGIMFECVQCTMLLDTIPAAGRHYQEKHGERYLVCYACGVDFRSTTNLYKHEKRCIAPDAQLVLKARAAYLGRKGRSRPYLTLNKFCSSPKRPKSLSRFMCHLCSAVFITKSNLESHENLHRGERPYRCHACPCAYTSSSALSRHTKKHSDVQFICDHCNRSFKIRAALVTHMDTHRPMRKHGCDECNRRFAQKSALILHVNRVHRNLPPPCACQICPKRYPRMSLLKAHMKRAHGLSIITRKMFFKSLPTMTELEVKQSKIILKHEDDLLSGTPQQTELDFETHCDQEFNENHNEHIESNNDTPDNDETAKCQDISMEEFMQYVKVGSQEIGSNTVYIQNGEVVQIAKDGGTQENLILEVEAMVDDQVLYRYAEPKSL